MILPHIEAGVLRAGQRVAAFPSPNSENMRTTAALIAREANRNGIILLTSTA
jgi:hypothetical protein